MRSGLPPRGWIFAGSLALTQACAHSPPPVAAVAGPGAPPPAAAAAPTLPPVAPLDAAEQALSESRYGEAEAGFRAQLGSSEGLRARLGLARVLMFTGRQSEAQALLGALTSGGKLPDASVATLLAESLIESGDGQAALAVLAAQRERPEARRARVLLGQLLIARGRRSEAEPVLLTLVQDYNEDRIQADDGPGLALVGRAAHLLRSPHDANDAFNAAERVAPNDPELLLWRAELFLEKHDPGHAEEVLGELLAKAPEQPAALVWMAHVKLEEALDFDAARAFAERALRVHPGFAPAYFVLAGLALRDLDFSAALDLISRGLASNPEDLELLSLRAAVAFLAEDHALFESTKRQVFGQNPSYSRFYSIVGEYAEWEHRYDRIVEMMRLAVSVDPDDAEAHAALGMNLIRAGQERAGLAELDRAMAKDPFNVRVFNTLNLYEEIIPEQYVTEKHGHFSIRYPKAEAALLSRYVPALLDRAYAKFVSAYAFKPIEPIGIELYSQREHFAVRTSGLPQTAILGVCFGKTLASLTPRAGALNLGMTLWHELAHVFHIQMSESHVPRWLTEGLAEYETLVERTEWRRHHDPELFDAWRARRLPQVAGMNQVFSHAEDLEDMATAYYASSQIAGFLVDRYGRPHVDQLLRAYAKGDTTDQAMQSALGSGADAVDHQFADSLGVTLVRYPKQFVPLEGRGSVEELEPKLSAAPQDLTLRLRLVQAALREKQLPLAARAWAEAHALAADSPDVRFLGARLEAVAGRPAVALAGLRALAESGHDGYAVQMAAAEVIDAKADPAALRAVLNAAHELDPTQAEPLQSLWRLAQEAKDEGEEKRVLRQLCPIDETNAGAYRRLLELLLAERALPEALALGSAALYVDLEGARTHVSYAQVLALAGRFADASFEFESALVCPSAPEEIAAAHRAYADFLRARGLGVRADAELVKAKEPSPDSAQPAAGTPP